MPHTPEMFQVLWGLKQLGRDHCVGGGSSSEPMGLDLVTQLPEDRKMTRDPCDICSHG